MLRQKKFLFVPFRGEFLTNYFKAVLFYIVLIGHWNLGFDWIFVIGHWDLLGVQDFGFGANTPFIQTSQPAPDIGHVLFQSP